MQGRADTGVGDVDLAAAVFQPLAQLGEIAGGQSLRVDERHRHFVDQTEVLEVLQDPLQGSLRYSAGEVATLPWVQHVAIADSACRLGCADRAAGA